MRAHQGDIRSIVPLTTNIETLPATGTAPVDATFNAPAGATLLGAANTLQSGDVLNGGGAGNVLNATLVTAAGATPTIRNVPTVNVTALQDLTANNNAGALNLGLSTGVTTLTNLNSVNNLAVTGVTAPLTTLNVTGGIGFNTVVQASASALNGAADAIQVNLSGQTAGQIILTPAGGGSATNGYDTVNVASTGANTVTALTAGPSADSLVATGGSLTVTGAAGAAALDASLTSVNASALTGAFTVGFINASGAGTTGSSVLAPANAALNFVGSANGTTVFAQSAALAANDTLAGGAGTTDTLVLTGAAGAAGTASAAVANTGGAFTASGFETLRVTDTNGNGLAGARAFDLANVSGVGTFQLNGGNSNNVATFNNVVYTAPVSVVNTGNGAAGAQDINGINLVFTPVSVFGNNNTVNYTFGNQGTAIGNATVTSGDITLAGIENVNITLNDLTAGTQGSDFDANVVANRATNVSIVSTGGRTAAGSIDLNGTAFGTGTVANALVNTVGGTTVTFSNAANAQIAVVGAGNSNVTANGAGAANNAAAVNGGAATGNLTLTTGGGADFILGGTGNDTLTGAGGADNQTGGTGNDRFTQEINSSVPFTAEAITEAAIEDGETITFGNGIDLITDFTAANDAIITEINNDFTYIADNDDVEALNTEANYGLRGDFNTATGVFTFDLANGDDVLVLVDTANATLTNAANDEGFFVAQGVGGDFAAANFV